MTVGIVELLKSKKATMSLIILACATVAVLMGKIDGTSFAAVVGTIGTIYCWTASKTDCEAMKMNMPGRGQP